MAESCHSSEKCDSDENCISINSTDLAKLDVETCNLLVECKTLDLDKESALEDSTIICDPQISLVSNLDKENVLDETNIVSEPQIFSANLDNENETNVKNVKSDAQMCCTFPEAGHSSEETEDCMKMVNVSECISSIVIDTGDNSIDTSSMHYSSEIVTVNSKELKTETQIESNTSGKVNVPNYDKTSILSCSQNCVQTENLE